MTHKVNHFCGLLLVVTSNLATGIRRGASSMHKIASVSMAALIGLTAGWLLVEAIVPPAAHSYTGRLSVSIDVQPGETFEAVTRRAEAVARAATQRSFDRDILVTDVQIVVSAENLSRIAPILSVEATRAQWSRYPDTRRWATYYKNAKALLGLTRSPSTTAVTPQATPPPTTPPPATIQPQPGPGSAPGSTPNPPAQFPLDETGGTTETPLNNGSQPAPSGRPQIIPDRIPSPVRRVRAEE